MNHFFTYLKKTLCQGTLQFLASIVLMLMFSTSLFAVNYTWNGTTNNEWSTSSNWSPSGTPGANDTININSGKPNLKLGQDRTVKRIIQHGSTIELDTNVLYITNMATFNDGNIIGDTLKLRGALVYFQGTDFNCTLDVIVGQIKFSGGTFDQNGSFEQNGSASGWGDGGCVFNADVTIKNSGTAYLRMGEDIGDTFNGKVYLISSGGYAIQMAYGDTSYFNDTIYINSNANGGVYFCNATSGAMALLGDNACLVTGSTGISAGTIQFKNIFQTATTANSITASGSVLFNVFVNTFGGKVNFTAPNLIVKTSTFNDSTFLTKTGSSLNNTWEGNNTYNAVVTITNGNTLTAYLKLASQSADVYNDDVYFNAGTGPIQAANAGTNIYNGNVAVNGNNVTFNNSGGTLKFSGSENQEFGGGTSTLTFNKLIVDKPGGTVTLNQPITIDSLLQLSNGIVYTDTLITLKATATTTGASNLSYVDGTVKKIGNTAFVFPVGADNSYYPIEISAPAVSTESFTAKYFAIHHSLSDSCDTTVSSISTCNYWRLKRNTGSTNVQVRLYWDSLGCGLFDTSGIHVINWNGVKWKDLGASEISGNSKLGSIATNATVVQYDYFTMGITLPIVNVQPILGDERDLAPDFFGFNGGNTIQIDENNDPVQTWEILHTNAAVLANPAATILGVPFGTLSNFADWRTGWPIIERDLPFNWFYDKNSYKVVPTSYLGNTYDFVRNNLNLLGAQAMITWNMMSSKFYYELASIYRLQELNVPIRYLEFGNEFYLNDEYYKEVFPSVNSYVDRSIEYATTFRNFQLPQTDETKIAMVGADIPESGPGRRRLWLDNALKRLPDTDNIDAIVIHDYIGEFPANSTSCSGSFQTSALYSYFEEAYVEEDYLKNETFNLIDDYNSSKFSSKPLEIWLTEFNMLDNNNYRIGTWSHGLFNSIMALKYLETEAITKVISHTLTSDGVYGNIFESTTGFKDVQCHGYPYGAPDDPRLITGQWELTAVGNALSQISHAMQDAEKAWPLDFSGTAAQNHTLDLNGKYPFLYGWVFERASNNREVVLLNLGGDQSYNLELNSIFPSQIASALSYEQITANNQSYAITGTAVLNGTASNQLKQTIGAASSNSLTGVNPYVRIQPFSVTRIFLTNPDLRVRLTDDEICSGSSTTLIIEGGTLPYNIPQVPGLSITKYNNNEHIWVITSSAVSATTPYPITVNGTVVCTLKVHQDLADLVIVDVSNSSFIPPTTFCYDPESNPYLILTALFQPSTIGSNGTLGDYHYLWAPDSGMIQNSCSTNLPMCESISVAPERTTLYTVYVTDDYCWKSASILVEVPVAPFDLGEDITVCENTPVTLSSNYEGTSPSYLWSTNETSETTDPLALSLGPNTFTLTVTDGGCTREDHITVNEITCCNNVPAGAISLKPNLVGTNYISHANILIAELLNSTACTNCVLTNGDEKTINGNLLTEDIYIDGTFLLRAGSANPEKLTISNCNILLGENASIIVEHGKTLVLENCTLTTCGTNMWRGIVLDKKGERNPPEIELVGCFIENAQTGLSLTRDAIYSISGNTFNNCYIDIDMSTYQSKVNPGASGYIFGNTFTSTGTLLSPHGSDKKYAGIVLNDVEEITVGAALSGTNNFNNSLYGIKSSNSSLKLINNTFSEILDNSSAPNEGTAVYAVSDFDQNDRFLIAGNGFGNGTNIFREATNGIYTEGEMNIDINKNTFGNSLAVNDRLLKYSIGIKRCGNKSILIDKDNSFYDYNYGVWIENDRDYKQLLIHDNDFFNYYDYPREPWQARSFSGSAITAINYIPTTLTNAEISLNTIGNSNTTPIQQARIGIRAANMERIRILDNRTYFNHATPPDDIFTGIFLQNCHNARMNINDVINVNGAFPAGSFGTLTGLRIHNSNSTCIENSTLTGLGFSMNFHGISVVKSLYTNTMTNFDTSICLVTADIGTPQGSATNVLNNRWFRNNMNNNTTGRVAGTLQGLPFIDWYHQGSVNSPNEFIPYSAGNIVIPNQPSSPTTLSTCPANFVFSEQDDPPYTATTRNSNYGYIVGDSGRFDEEHFHEYRYLSRGELYLTLKNNPELLSMDDSADDSFVEFYADMSGSNYQLFDSVFALMESGDLLAAESIVLAIDDTNDIEYNMKTVLKILLHSLIVDSVLSVSDSTLLIEIAYRNPLTGGNGVFIARHLLNLEIYDEEESGSRIASFNQNKHEKKSIEVYPVPSKDEVYIKPSADFIPDGLELFSVNGELVFRDTFKNYLNIDFLKAGIYIVKVFSGTEFMHAKIVKLP